MYDKHEELEKEIFRKNTNSKLDEILKELQSLKAFKQKIEDAGLFTTCAVCCEEYIKPCADVDMSEWPYEADICSERCSENGLQRYEEDGKL